MILSVGNVSKSFGTDVILENVSFRIERGEKVALVGRNGTGKTTLLRIITGSYEPDGGSVQIARGARIGYLRQDMPVSAGRTVREEAQQGVAEQLLVKAHLDSLERRLEEGAPSQEDLEEYATLHERFMESGGYSAHRDVDSVLLKMGFEPDEMEKPTGSLSGGEKTRLALARLLLEEPDLLILDEPTNHLDLQATEWLESWLRQYPGAVLL
ncbi:ABC-F family ATP-binding cassette domain-containing protein, partial [bacterium]